MAERIEIKLPAEQQEGTKSIIGRWLKALGDPVKQHEPLIEISTDKVSVEIASPADGFLEEILCNEGAEVQPGQVLGLLRPGKVEAKPASAELGRPAIATASQPSALGELSPGVRKLLREHKIDPALIKGSGPSGRIVHDDVLKFLEDKAPQAVRSKIPSKFIKHSAMRRSIAAHMVESALHTAPHVTSVFEVDLSAVIAHRDQHRNALAARGIKLTYTAYFILAACKALQAVPEVNSRWHEEGLEIFEQQNIGVAVALDHGGLIVPVIHSAGELGLNEIATQLEEVTNKARKGTLESSDVQAGTFTISNHGTSGSLIATPIIINQPQSAILGIGKLEQRVTVDPNGQFVARPKLYVTLTIDHRVLDGFAANKFLAAFSQTLENIGADSSL